MSCLIVFGVAGLCAVPLFCYKALQKQQGDSVRVVILKAFAQLFGVFGENEVRPRVIQTHLVGGPVRGYGEG